jgi:hypothetical protein
MRGIFLGMRGLVRSYVTFAIIRVGTLFWDLTPCSPVQVFRLFGGTCCLHHRQRVNQASRGWLPPASFWLLGLNFDSEDGSSKVFRNFGKLLNDASTHRRWQFSSEIRYATTWTDGTWPSTLHMYIRVRKRSLTRVPACETQYLIAEGRITLTLLN